MKIITTALIFATFCIPNLSVNAKGEIHVVYDLQQFSQLDLGNLTLIQNYTFDTNPYRNEIILLKNRNCYVPGAFTPAHDNVSQVRVVFPTESLREVWDNSNYLIGFAVVCNVPGSAEISNTNWYKFSQSGLKLNFTLKYTSFSMDSHKCRRNNNAEKYWRSGSRHITGMEIVFKTGGKKSKKIRTGMKEFRAKPEIVELPITDIPLTMDCGNVNNIIPLYMPDIKA